MNTENVVSQKVTALEKYTKLCKKVSNKELVDALIEKYHDNARCAVQHILNMSLAVKEIDDKVKSDKLKEDDLNYFCASVNLDKNSSTYRKFLCIADKAEIFMSHLEKLPASYTILYEITTLDSEKFEKLVNDDRFTRFITLKEVKAIADKKSASLQYLNADSIVIKFDQSLISASTRALLENFLKRISLVKEVKVTCSKALDLSCELKQAA